MLRLTVVTVCISAAAAAGSWHYPYNATEWGGVCASGTSQSPIDFPTCATAHRVAQTKISVNYTTHRGTLQNNGHAIQVNVNASEIFFKFTSATGEYKLLQCHWHDGSEHTVGGTQYDFSGHCVHQKIGSSRYGVLGLLYTVGSTEDPFLKLLEDHFPNKGNTALVDKDIDFAVLANQVNNITNYWTYPGSLTTPGCNEVVDWHVIMEPFTMTQAQLTKLENTIGWKPEGGTFRPPQPLNNRTIVGCQSTSNTNTSTTSAASNASANASGGSSATNTDISSSYRFAAPFVVALIVALFHA